jgi:hypothetical protein
MEAEALVDSLHRHLSRPAAAAPFEIADDLKLSSEAYRNYARHAAEHWRTDRRLADFAASFATEAKADDGQVADTALRTMSGAGHQHFLKFMRDLVICTTREQLSRALFGPWTYKDPGPSLRWDPSDDRRYALRWNEPSGDPVRTERGANRLAVEGLSLLPVMVVGRKLETTGFSGHGRSRTFWTWPIWDSPLSVDSVRSILALSQLQERFPPRSDLRARGIVEVYRSQRLTIGKYRNFSPAGSV